jgi:arylsulfatase A-like enzyme
MKQYLTLALCLLWAASGGRLNSPLLGASKPNVILILSDDHRYDFMGFLQRVPGLETPAMDRMAREGLHFRNAFVATSLCSPSRASILTGRYAHDHGVVDNQRPIPEGTTFFPSLLQRAGYQTGFVGKWHMGDVGDEPQPGFDHWISYEGQGTYYDPYLNVNGTHVRREGYTADIVTDYAVEWIDRVSQGPFFLFLSHKSVHAMFEPAKRHLGRYENLQIPYPSTMAGRPENYAGKPRWVREQRNSWHGVDYMYHGEMDFDTFYRRYLETLLGLDESIARLLDHLVERGLDRDTVVIYMSDNGFCLGEHGLIDKRHMYEESVRVPVLVWAPGLFPSPREVQEMVQNIDMAPTILELAGLPVPKDMDGRSFLPLLRGEPAEWRDAIFYEYYWEWNFPQTPTVFGIRTDQFKYIFYHGIWDIDELYDVVNDPEEKKNLALEPEHQNLLQKLRHRLFDWLEEEEAMSIPFRRPLGFRAADRKP